MFITIFKTDLQNGETTKLESKDQFLNLITTYKWSPSIFNNEYRNNENFKSTNFMVLDIDDSLPLSAALEQIKLLGFTCIIGTSRNHRKEKNGVIADRYRLIFPLQNQINDADDYSATWEALSLMFPELDKQCKDQARFYYPCSRAALHTGYRKFDKVKGSPQQEEHVERVKQVREAGELGIISSRTATFLEKGGDKCFLGVWHQEFLYAARDLKAQGYSQEEATNMLRSITGVLDTKHDLPQIKYVYENDKYDFDWRKK